jgi:hypothetical protein
MSSDGEHLPFLTVKVIDSQGHVVPTLATPDSEIPSALASAGEVEKRAGGCGRQRQRASWR